MATNTLTADSRVYDFEYDGDPNGVILGDQGDRCAHLSLGIMYLKTQGLSRDGWIISTTGEQPVVSVNGQTGIVVVTKADVGLSDVDNTSDLDKPLSLAAQSALDNKQSLAERGFPNGYASLDEFGLVPADQLPTIVGMDLVTSVNGEIGDVFLDKVDIGLANVDNTGDLFKPISNATQTALNGKQNLSDRGQVNGYAPLGSDGLVPSVHLPEFGGFAPVTSVNGEIGDVVLDKVDIGLANVDNTADAVKPVSIPQQTALDAKQSLSQKGVASGYAGLGTDGKVPSGQLPAAPVTSVNSKTGVVVINKTDVGLGNVDNTSDANKPISTLQAAAFATKQDLSAKSLANGYASLDATGKVPLAELPPLGSGGNMYQGTWNAATNTPTIPVAAPANSGWFYVVSVAGTTTIDGISSWSVGDQIISNGTVWQKIPSFQSVTSVNGETGSVVIDKTDVGLGNVDNTSDLAKPLSTATTLALSAKQDLASRGQPNGYAALDGSGKVPVAQLPADAVTSVNAKTGVVVLNKGDIALGNVDNTSDATKNSAVATLTNKTIDGANNVLNVRLANDVSGNLPVSRLNGGLDASSSTFWRGDGSWQIPVGAGNVVGPAGSNDGEVALFSGLSGQILRRFSGVAGFAKVSTTGVLSSQAQVAGSELVDGSITDGKIAAGAVTPEKMSNAARIPVGAVADFAGNTAPEGWLLCAGQAVSRTTYAALFAVVGGMYGVGDGSTTFNVPDCRGRLAAGKDNMGGTNAGRLSGVMGTAAQTLGGVGGNQLHTLTVGEMPSHGHSFTYNYPQGTFTGGLQSGSPFNYTPVGQGSTTAANGGGGSHNNVQPTIIFNKIIRWQ